MHSEHAQHPLTSPTHLCLCRVCLLMHSVCCSMCEIARNSVLQSGFPVADKKHWIGASYHRRGSAGNVVKQSNVPNIRLLFRDELLAEEENWILGLPPPIFPSIKLDQRWKTKKRSLGKGKGQQMQRVSDHMNYLVAHRTNIPFNLHQETSPPQPLTAKKGTRTGTTTPLESLREVSSKYDPLGYFARSGHQKENKHNALHSKQWKLERVRHDEGGEYEGGTVSVMQSVKGMVKRHFVTVALGVVIGILATVNYQRTMEKDKGRQQRHKDNLK